MYRKAIGNIVGGPESGLGQGLRESPVWAYSVRLMEFQIWFLLADSVGKGSEKKQWPLPALVYGRKLPPSSRPYVRQFDFSPYVPGAFQAAAPALELTRRESE